MNHIYNVLWNQALGRFCVTSELGRSRSRATTRRNAGPGPGMALGVRLPALAMSVALAWAMPAWSQTVLPQGAKVVAGNAQVTAAGNQMTVQQGSDKAILNWQSFNIGAGNKVTFQQPNASSVALNRVVGAEASAIHGSLNANGKVFLVNPNGVLFGQGANVNVGGLVASTLDISNENFLKGHYQFNGQGTGLQGAAVTNQGTITASQHGAVALLGGTVSNQGAISARLGSVALAAGNQVTLDFAGDGLLNVQVDQSAVNALAENQQLLQADGGSVLIAAKATDALLQTVVNNTGTVQARTVGEREGKIVLLGGFNGGTARVAGTLDAAAPEGGNGGFIETSGAHVKIADGAQITTKATHGRSGTWLIDPNDFTVAATGGDITGRAVEEKLATNGNVIFATATMGTSGGNGDIHINEDISWTENTLTLSAERNINVNAIMTASGTAGLEMNYGGYSASSQTASAGSGVHMAMAGQGFAGRVDFTGTDGNGASTNRLMINGANYTILTQLGSEGSTTALDLQGISGNPSGNYALGASIEASDTAGWAGGAGFAPIGTFDGRFTGTFDGLGHTISGLHINSQDGSFAGLFGQAENATLRNVGLVNNSVTSSGFVGGLVGWHLATGVGKASISNVSVSGEVSGLSAGGVAGQVLSSGGSSVSISHAYASGTVSGQWVAGGLAAEMGAEDSSTIRVVHSHASSEVSSTQYAGGLAGTSNADVSDSSATGNVSGNYYIGGLIGINYGSISNSHATGEVSGISSIGGLVGKNESYQGIASISNTFASGNVSGTSTTGGLVGWNTAGEGAIARISNSHAQGVVSGKQNVGGLVGANSSYASGQAIIFNAYATGDVSGSVNVGGLVGASETSVPSGPSSTSIGTANISHSFATGNVSGDTQSIGGLVGTNAIFDRGTIDISNSHASGKVSGTGSAANVGGLVGSNLHLAIQGDSNVGAITIAHTYATGDVSGHERVGGLIGENDIWSAPFILTNAYSTGNVSGYTRVGGVVGDNKTRDFATSSISNVYATGTVAGSVSVGGLVGYHRAGFRSTAGISNAYATGQVLGGWTVGGLIGTTEVDYGWAPISNAYWNTETTGQATSAGGGQGLTTAEMFDAGRWGNFGFGTVWGNGNQQSTPYLLGMTGNQVFNKNDLPTGITADNRPKLYTVLLDVDQLQTIQKNLSGRYVLGRHIDASVTATWSGAAGFLPIGTSDVAFTGTFDGLSYTVNGLTINRPDQDNVGLFGWTENATLRNVALVGGSVTGKNSVGGLVGTNYAKGRDQKASISNVYTTGNVSGLESVGGLVGTNQAVDEGTASIANVYSTGNVLGQGSIGGLVGSSLATGGSARISNAYETGEVSGDTDVGILVGKNNGEILSSYWNTDTSGQSIISGGTGLDSQSMKKLTSFDGWDISAVGGSNAIWRIYEGYTAPLLRSFMTPLTVTPTTTSIVYDGLSVRSNMPYGPQSLGTLSYTTTSKNVGTYQGSNLVLSGLHSSQLGYDISYAPISLFITRKSISGTITAENKIYDGNTNASITAVGSLSGVVTGDTVSINASSGRFNNKNAGQKTVTAGLTGQDAANYLLINTTTNASITAKTLTATATAANKVYDGNDTAVLTLNNIQGLVAGENVTATGTGTFNSKNVPEANTVTVNSVTLANGANGLAGNYSLASGQKAAASITAKPLTATAAAANKVYDGNDIAALTLDNIQGLVAGENVIATGTGRFNSKNVPEANTVTVNSVALANGANGLAGNYSLASGQKAAATIVTKVLSASAVAGSADRTYNGNDKATASLDILSGLVDGETLVATGSGTFNSKNVRDASTVTLDQVALADGAGGLASNYGLALGGLVGGAQMNAVITPKVLTAATVAGSADRTYNGNDKATASLNILSGLVEGESLAGTGTGTFNSRNVRDASTVTLDQVGLSDGEGGGLASNYDLALGGLINGPQMAAVITPKALTASTVAGSADRTYNGNDKATASLNILSGLVEGESLAGTGTGTFNSRNVHDADSVTLNQVALADGEGGLASNYELALGGLVNGPQMHAVITPKALTASTLAGSADRTYNGNDKATASLNILSGLVEGESLAGTGTGTFNSKNVHDADSVTLNQVALADGEGGLASNYELALGGLVNGPQMHAVITPKALTASTLAGSADRTYNGNDKATASLNILSGLVEGESLAGTGTGTFNSKNVHDADSVTLNQVALADGEGGLASNYDLALGGLVNGTQMNAVITPKVLTAATVAGSADRTYNGNDKATADLSILTGLVEGESIAASGSGTFNSKNVRDASTVTLDQVALADGQGGSASNYDLSLNGLVNGTQMTAVITPKVLTGATVAGSADRTYNGNDKATADLSILTGLVEGESIAASGSGTFNSKNVRDASTVTLDQVALADGQGGLASNYDLSLNGLVNGTQMTAVITPKVLTAATVAGSADRTYNGNDKATADLNILTGLVEGESIAASGSGTFNSKNVGDASTVTLNQVALADGEGGLASNYDLALGGLVNGTQMNAVITPKVLTAATVAGSADRTYNGNDKATADLSILTGLVEGESIAASGSGTFNSKNVRDASSVTLDQVALADGQGGLASNYDLSLNGLVNGTQMTAVITPKVLTAATVPGSADRTYNGNDKATADLNILTGLVEGESIAGSGTGIFNSKNVRDASTVTLDQVALADGQGGLASNYDLSLNGLVNGTQMTAVITPKVLTAATVAGSADRTYNGNDKATADLSILTGLVEGESIAASGSGTFNSKNVRDASTVTLDQVALADGEGGLASNYDLALGGLVNGTQMNAVITPKVLTAATVAGSADRTYNGNDKATADLSILTGLVEGESIAASGSGTFNSKNVRDASSVTLDQVALADGQGGLASNYDLSLNGLVNGTQMTAVITPKVLTAATVAGSADRTYNGNDKATADLNILTGLVEGESIAASGSGTFNSKNVGDASSVTLNQVALADGEGGLASNYDLALGGLVGGSQMIAVITPRVLTAAAVAGSANKTDNGNDEATARLDILSGLVEGENLNATGSGTFNSRNVGDASTVTLYKVALSNGEGAGLASNYDLPLSGLVGGTQMNAVITPKAAPNPGGGTGTTPGGDGGTGTTPGGNGGTGTTPGGNGGTGTTPVGDGGTGTTPGGNGGNGTTPGGNGGTGTTPVGDGGTGTTPGGNGGNGTTPVGNGAGTAPVIAASLPVEVLVTVENTVHEIQAQAPGALPASEGCFSDAYAPAIKPVEASRPDVAAGSELPIYASVGGPASARPCASTPVAAL